MRVSPRVCPFIGGEFIMEWKPPFTSDDDYIVAVRGYLASKAHPAKRISPSRR